jgi:hypothetical protein
VVSGHLAQTRPIAGGLDLYYALERATSLLEFHTMLRPGERNRNRDGLQQSYGDHNRLLMRALDRLLAGDVDWLRAHAAAGSTLDDDSLRRCAAVAGGLDLEPEVEVALWLGAALHDCGMLRGQGAHVDVEDGLALAAPVLQQYCPEATRPLAAFALRHHDYVKDAFLGEAPVGAIADDLAVLDPAHRPLALIALGLIQVAGASSLGEGRLSNLRLDIFHACADGTALDDRSGAQRLARLLTPVPDRVPGDVAISDPGGSEAVLDALLDETFVHGWHAFAAHADPATRRAALVRLADANREWDADHLVLHEDLRRHGSGLLPADLGADRHLALSGAVIVTVEA